MSRPCLAALVLIAALSAGCQSLPQRPPPPSLPEVVQMARDKVAAEEIIRRMRDSGAVYNLRGSDYAKLRADGIPDAVLDYMQRQQIEQARYEEWLAARDRLTWGPFGWRRYPYGPYWSPWGAPPAFWPPLVPR